MEARRVKEAGRRAMNLNSVLTMNKEWETVVGKKERRKKKEKQKKSAKKVIVIAEFDVSGIPINIFIFISALCM